MRRLLAVLIVLALLLGLTIPAVAGPAPTRTVPPLTAMTFNLYIGADIYRILEPVPECAGVPSPPGPEGCSVIVQGGAALAEIQSTDFAERAVALARLIRKKRPAVVGLQEVSLLTTVPTDPFGTPVGPPVVADHLTMLLAALNERGPIYEVAAVVDNVTTPFLPAGSFVPGVGPVIENLAMVADRDVILARSDVEYVPAGDGNYATNLTIDLAGTPLEFTRGWVAVDVTVKGVPIRVVNTHLEPQYTDPAFIPANAIQTAQAVELMTLFGGFADPLVLLGDYNSAPAADNGLPGVPTPYEVIAGAGFTDAWTLRKGKPVPGFTCCQDADLRNRKSALDERIDLVWLRSAAGAPRLSWIRTMGDRHAQKTPSGLWASDHAGVVARVLLAHS